MKETLAFVLVMCMAVLRHAVMYNNSTCQHDESALLYARSCTVLGCRLGLKGRTTVADDGGREGRIAGN